MIRAHRDKWKEKGPPSSSWRRMTLIEKEREKGWRHFVWWSSGNAIELMTRDYWALLDGRRGLICGPHFILHEVTTLGDYVEFYGKPPIFYTYTYTYVFASTLNWQVFLYESIASISLTIFLLISSLTDSHLKINIHIYNDFCDIYHTLTMCFHKKISRNFDENNVDKIFIGNFNV